MDVLPTEPNAAVKDLLMDAAAVALRERRSHIQMADLLLGLAVESTRHQLASELRIGGGAAAGRETD